MLACPIDTDAPPIPASRLTRIALLAIAYALIGWCARLVWLNDATEFHASAIWPSAGIAVGVLLTRGVHLWPGILIGAFLVDYPFLRETLGPGSAALGALLIGMGATLQALTGRALVRRFMPGDLTLDTAPTLIRFFVLAGMIAALVGATVGTFAVHILATRSPVDSTIEWITWWAGEAIGVVLAAPIIMTLCGLPRAIWRPRRATVGAPLALTILIVAIAFMLISRLERDNRLAEFDRHALQAAGNLQTTFGDAADASHALADFLKTNPVPERDRFNLFAGGMHDRHAFFRAIEWIPRAEAPGSGDERFPLQYAYPSGGNLLPLGTDMSTETWRWTTFVTARREQTLALSDRVAMPADGVDRWGILAVSPIFGEGASVGEDGLAGFALMLIDVSRLAESGLNRLAQAGIVYRLEDPSAPPTERLLYRQGGEDPATVRLQSTHPVQYGDRTWQLTVVAGPDYQLAQRAWYIWPTLAGGALISGMLAFFLLMLSGRSQRTEQLVMERTRELEAARNAAEKTNQLFVEAVSSITHGFTIYDEHDRLVICNDAYRQLYATSADLIVPGNSFENVIRGGVERGQYPAAAGREEAWIRERVAQHRNATGELIEQRLGDGRWLLITEHRTPSGYTVGNRIDITELKRTAAALGERNAQMDAIFQLSPDGLVTFGWDKRIKSVNPAFTRMTGLPAHELLDHTQVELEARLRQLTEPTEPWSGLEDCFAKVSSDMTAGGLERYLIKLAAPHDSVLELVGLTSEDSTLERLLYVRDITHEVEVDRMKSEFLSHAAHELRTPMASIFGFTELLIAQEFEAEMRRELLATIHKQTSWLVEIINELLDIARIEARRGKDFKIEAVRVEPLVADVLAGLQADPDRWPVTLSLPASLPAVRADLAKLRQSITNILGNAVKYSPRGGAIDIRGTTRDTGDRQLVGLVVADHGIGMTTQQAARVCERFYRADTSGNIPGTGLGMAIVKEIVELLGGTIEIESKPDAGTTVTLWLPAAQDIAATSRESTT